MLPFEERLEQFGRIIEASIDELIVLTQSAPVTESAVAAQAVLGRYGRLVAQIGDIAARQQLSGAHAVCALVETNLLLLQDDKRTLSADESATLEAWPMLLLGYLANRADREASTALLQSLAGHWPISLPLESAADELRLLMGQDAPPSPGAAGGEPPATTAEPAVTAAGAAALPSVVPEEEPTGLTALMELTGDASLAPALVSAAPAPLPLPEEARDQEATPVAVDAPSFDAEATMTDAGPASAASPATPAGLAALSVLADPRAAALPPEDIVRNHAEPGFPSTIAVEGGTAAPLQAGFAETAPDEATPHLGALAEPSTENIAGATGGAGTLPPPASGTQHVTRPMLDVLLDELRPLNEAFESVIAEASQSSNDERLEALGELLDFMERLRVTVETIGLSALAALLTRIKLELVQLPDGLSENHRALLQRLPRAMMAYLQAPNATAAAAGLVNLLADDRWSAPLAAQSLAAWRAALADIELSEPATAPGRINAPEPSLEATDEAGPDAAAAACAETPSARSETDAAIRVSAAPGTAALNEPAPAALRDRAETAAGAPSVPLPDTAGQYVEQAMVQILLDELQPLNGEFTALASAATEGAADDRLAALGDLLDFLERVKITVDGIGLTALATLLSRIAMQIVSLPEGLGGEHLDLLHRLPDALTAYLRAPDDAAAGADLVALLADARWPVVASEDTRAAWRAALANVELSETSAHLMPARPTEAMAEDVSLELPAEVNSELLDGLLQELPVQVAAFTSAVASITGGSGTLKDVDQAMRAAHTLKGAANTVGIPGIANLTHQLEDILVALREAESLPQGALADVLIDAGDCLEAMSESLLGLGAAPDNAQAILQQVLDLANRIDSEGISELSSTALTTAVDAPAPEAAPARVAPASRAAPSEADAADQGRQPQAATEQSLRVPAPLVDELLSLAGETLISNSQLQDHLKSTLHQNRAIRQQHQLILKLVSELETLVDIRGITSQQQGAGQGDGFDALEFEHYNELQTISRQLLEAATDAREMSNMAEQELDALEEMLGEQQRLQMANQHTLLRTRMMPVSNIIPRLQRSVRQTGRLLDKEVEFTVKGEGTRLDTNVLNDLMDPLMHMLRNAVDHGIERPDVRLAAGKCPEGHIELSFAREGGTIVVRCRDDGAGLDHEAIRRIAEGKGMIVPGHIHTNEELARLILMPGFSTRDEASQVSGRGVGMDVVYSRVQQMKGMLALHSQKGKGLTIELRLPATLLSMHALIIRQRERRFAISTRGIEDIRYVPREDVVEIAGRQFVRDGDKMYALLRLEQALPIPPDRRAKDRAGHPVLLLRMEDDSERAVLVQEVLESREIVMKKFNRFVPHVNGIVGAAILGNGEVAPVIDLFDLLHAPMRQLANAQRAQSAGATGMAPEEKPRRALVVDDSLSARRAVVQLLKDEGYEIRTANDGLEAVSVLEKWIPDIIISDMEMPRMNGLELTSNVRHTEQTRHVPVIMITSRSTAKHRQMSAAAGVNLHMIKPFSDDELITQVSKLTEKVQ